MTYKKASDYYNGAGGSLNDLTDGQARAIRAISIFLGRRGFDEFWREIESKIKDHIFEELSQSLDL